MSKLVSFIENFDIENLIKIYDKNENLIYEGEIGNISQEIIKMTSVIRGTAKGEGKFLKIKVS